MNNVLFPGGEGIEPKYELGHIQCNDNYTGFLAKLRHIKAFTKDMPKLLQREEMKCEEETRKGIIDDSLEKLSVDNNIECNHENSLFSEGETVILIPVQQPKPKKGRRRQRMVKLCIGDVFNNDWGQLKHEDLIGQCEGSVVKTSANTDVYVVRPTLQDYSMLYGQSHQWQFNQSRVSNTLLHVNITKLK